MLFLGKGKLRVVFELQELSSNNLITLTIGYRASVMGSENALFFSGKELVKQAQREFTQVLSA